MRSRGEPNDNDFGLPQGNPCMQRSARLWRKHRLPWAFHIISGPFRAGDRGLRAQPSLLFAFRSFLAFVDLPSNPTTNWPMKNLFPMPANESYIRLGFHNMRLRNGKRVEAGQVVHMTEGAVDSD